MCRHYTADLGRKKRQYITRVLLGCLGPVNILVTLLTVLALGKDSIQPIKYYEVIIQIFCGSTGLLLMVILVGGLATERHLRSHSLYSYIEIHGKLLLISQGAGSFRQFGRHRDIQKLWVMELENLEDAYTYGKKLVFVGKMRYFHTQAEWLTMRRHPDQVGSGFMPFAPPKRRLGRGEEEVPAKPAPKSLGQRPGSWGLGNGTYIFENWWFNRFGGRELETVTINDIFRNGSLIVDLVVKAAEQVKEREEQRRQFRERMLMLASRRQTTAKGGRGSNSRNASRTGRR